EVAKAVELLRGTVRIEVSGGVSLDSVGAYAEAGVDFIAIGAITHSARALDIGLDVL
ncbi:MAG: nicotinate-nucleotide diphosphorylase (carboxylating), partial [Candidatus Rokubacteria bacterium]|nr:nicotinate-nucleotide diphosphorylase (carboxylating) [Candidatus Rokubacteria bacterium]